MSERIFACENGGKPGTEDEDSAYILEAISEENGTVTIRHGVQISPLAKKWKSFIKRIVKPDNIEVSVSLGTRAIVDLQAALGAHMAKHHGQKAKKPGDAV